MGNNNKKKNNTVVCILLKVIFQMGFWRKKLEEPMFGIEAKIKTL